MPILLTAVARCDHCYDEITEENIKLNAGHYPIWSGLSDEIRKKGWRMKLNEKKNDWSIICYDCKEKNIK